MTNTIMDKARAEYKKEEAASAKLASEIESILAPLTDEGFKLSRGPGYCSLRHYKFAEIGEIFNVQVSGNRREYTITLICAGSSVLRPPKIVTFYAGDNHCDKSGTGERLEQVMTNWLIEEWGPKLFAGDNND